MTSRAKENYGSIYKNVCVQTYINMNIRMSVYVYGSIQKFAGMNEKDNPKVKNVR